MSITTKFPDLSADPRPGLQDVAAACGFGSGRKMQRALRQRFGANGRRLRTAGRRGAATKPWRLLLAVLLAAGGAAHAESALEGRWEGEAAIPGRPLPLVLDLAPDAGGAWAGSFILPGRGVKGAPLRALEVGGDRLEASLAVAFGSPAGVQLRRQADGSLAGEFRQGGHVAALRLVRSGAAQVDRAPAATAVARELEGVWRGRYELGGYAREVTLTLSNQAGGPARGELLIVGKRSTRLAIDHVQQGAAWLLLRASEADIEIEGPWPAAGGEIEGSLRQGPFEAALVLRRAVAETR